MWFISSHSSAWESKNSFCFPLGCLRDRKSRASADRLIPVRRPPSSSLL